MIRPPNDAIPRLALLLLLALPAAEASAQNNDPALTGIYIAETVLIP